MGLHRLLGLTATVPDPAALAAFYGELGLTGSPDSGFTGTEGGAAVTYAGDKLELVHAFTDVTK